MTMRLTRLISLYSEQLWAIEPLFFAAGQRLLLQAMMGQQFTGAEIHAALDVPDPADPQQQDRRAKAGAVRVGIVPVMGVIENHTQSMGTSARQIRGMFDKAIMDPGIDAILFDIHSPGGVVAGVPELAAYIAQSAGRDSRPMLAFNAGMMASAAYWIGAAVGEVMATDSAQTGSIGVVTWHEDWSQKLENDGIKITQISAGEGKGAGMPWNPMTEEYRANLEAMVKQADSAFVKAVAAARGTTQTAIRDLPNRGMAFTSADALKTGLIDSVGTFDNALNRLASQVSKRRAKTSRAQAVRGATLRGLGVRS